jgi:hypothetical protein
MHGFFVFSENFGLIAHNEVLVTCLLDITQSPQGRIAAHGMVRSEKNGKSFEPWSGPLLVVPTLLQDTSRRALLGFEKP